MGLGSSKNSRAKSTFTTATGCEVAVSLSVRVAPGKNGDPKCAEIFGGHVRRACPPIFSGEFAVQRFHAVVESTLIGKTQPDRNVCDPGDLVHARHAAVDEALKSVSIMVASIVKRELADHDVGCIKPGRQAAQMDEAANHQAGRGHDDHGQGNFTRDECLPEEARSSGNRLTSSSDR